METTKQLGGLMLIGFLVTTGVIYAISVQPVVTGTLNFKDYDVKTFTSYEKLTEFISGSSWQSFYYDGWLDSAVTVPNVAASEKIAIGTRESDDICGGATVDFSKTNVQVAGVDEPDVVKTDGTYLYIVSQNKVIIVKAFPAENATIEAELSFNESTTVQNLFIYGDKLVIFSMNYGHPIVYTEPTIKEETTIQISEDDKGDEIGMPAPWYSTPTTLIKIYDMTSLQEPDLIRDISVGGTYSGARLIDAYVYVITTQYSYDYYLPEDEPFIPRLLIDEEVVSVPLSDIYYIDLPEKSSTITNILSINLDNDDEPVTTEVFLLGNSRTLYVSQDNIYVAYATSNYYDELFQEILDEILAPVLPNSFKEEIDQAESLSLNDHQKQTVIQWILQHYLDELDETQQYRLSQEVTSRVERTIIHRIAISDGDITYEAQGAVPGSLNNQFSLDEYDGHLRVASTVQGWVVRGFFFSGVEEQTGIYVLDMDLDIIGSISGLAPGERIFASRFIDDKCYLVTYEQVDPFFVIDLDNPANPTVLGELKIPGFSTYLHPYDDAHIIGIGRDENIVKISLFDVTDVTDPIELAKYEITNDDEDWHWMQSSALYEHKAFLFDQEKDLLVIPVGDYSKQSAYVFDITSKDGISLRGTITHDFDNDEPEDEWYYGGDYGNSIQRTLYIDDVLYTISNNLVKMNDLTDLHEINSVELT